MEFDDGVETVRAPSAVERVRYCSGGGTAPVVIGVETKTSHGYMPTDKRIAQLGDAWAFTGWNMGVQE